MPHNFEIIFVTVTDRKSNKYNRLGFKSHYPQVRFISTQKGRGKQLNAGARAAKKEFLWFLHADSRLTRNTFESLCTSLNTNSHALHYFNLEFLKDGPSLMKLNTIGCWIRSHLMGVPFGDQGFCISRKNFRKVGGFPENVKYGEDHLFIWHAKQKGIPLRCTGGTIKTSARKYKDRGWVRTTLSHARLWTKQAFPEWRKLRKR